VKVRGVKNPKKKVELVEAEVEEVEIGEGE